MEISYIEEFVVLAKICNYSRAADALFVSQSSLFNHIKALESELGVPLFNRKGKNIVLSDYGQIFLPYAKTIITASKDYVRMIKNNQDEQRKKLYIGTQYRITDLVKDFCRQYPEYELRMFDNYSAIEALIEGSCELAFIRDIPASAKGGYGVVPYVKDTIVAVVYASHPLAKRKHVRLHDLKDEDFVMVAQHQELEPYVLKYCKSAGFFPRIVMTAVNGMEAARLVNEGFGISLFLKRTIVSEDFGNLVLIDLDPPIECTVSLCWLKDRPLSDGAKELIKYVNESYTPEEDSYPES